MVMEASDVEGAFGRTTGVVRGAVEVASGIDGAWASSTDSMESLSCCACSTCGSIGGVGLGGTPRGAE